MTLNFSDKRPVIRCKELIQLLKFYPRAYWLWALRRCRALIRIFNVRRIILRDKILDLVYLHLGVFLHKKELWITNVLSVSLSLTLIIDFNPFEAGVAFHIDTIWFPLQILMTGFHMKCNTGRLRVK